MANKGKFSQPRDPKPQDHQEYQPPQDDELDLSFLDDTDSTPAVPDAPIPDSLLSDPLLGDPVAEAFLPEEPAQTPPATAIPVATDPALADAPLAMDLDDDGDDDEFDDDDQVSTPSIAKNKKIIMVSLCGVALVVLIGLVAAVTFLLGGGKDDGLILNNVTVAGVNLGGMTQEEAVRVLRAATENTYTRQEMVVVLPEATLTLSPADTGAKLDVEAAAEAAYLYGRTGSWAERKAAKEKALTGAHHIALLPYLQLNTGYIRQELEKYTSSFSSDFVQSSATLEGEMPELEGDKFDPDAPCQTLVLNPGVPGRNMDLEMLINAVLDAYSFNNFRVDMDEENLTAEPEKLDLEALLKEYSREPISATLNPENKQINPETYGYSFDLEKAQELLNAAEPGVTVSVPMEYVEPEYTRETLFGDVLGACDTPHSANANRNTNLKLACAAINDLILLPGEVFDYNEVVGERTVEKGYKAAPAYSSGQTVQEIGGGICQVSSTLYLAALRADLEIVERYEHSFVSSYIPYGMDATVSWGGPEFRFRNNTEHAIRIKAWVTDDSVFINLMGIDDRTYYVEMEYKVLAWEAYETIYEEYAPDNPEGYKDGDIIETPYTGCTVRTYRCRYDKETGELISREEEARSKYQKRDEVVVKIVDPTEEPSEDPTDPSDPTEPSTQEPTDGPTEPSTQEPTDGPTEPVETEPPVTETPSTEPPATEAPATESPATQDPPEGSQTP